MLSSHSNKNFFETNSIYTQIIFAVVRYGDFLTIAEMWQKGESVEDSEDRTHNPVMTEIPKRAY